MTRLRTVPGRRANNTIKNTFNLRLLAMGRNRESQVYRVRQLPLHLEDRGATASFLSKIASVLGAVDNIRVFSLAQEKPVSKTATVSFNILPSIFDNDDEQWTLPARDVCERNIIVDVHFRDFTVLSEPQNCEHTIEWVLPQCLKKVILTHIL